MNLGRRLTQLEDETTPSAEIGGWCMMDSEPFSPSAELRDYVEQQAEGRARVAVWLPDGELGPIVVLVPDGGARLPLQLVEVPPELAGEDGP